MDPLETLRLAKEEINRADHSIAVSLKYTRTVDVIKGIIQRLINTINYSLKAYLEHEQKKGKVDEVPEVPRLLVEKARETFSDNSLITQFCDFYLLLRRIDKATFTRAQEYRRHVTMTATLDDGQVIEITIDIITDYFNKTKEFFTHIEKALIGND